MEPAVCIRTPWGGRGLLTDEVCFSYSSVPHTHISTFRVIPKNHQPNKWQLIVDFSHPKGHSVKSRIPTELCYLSYITVDNAIAQAQIMGRGTLLMKIDTKKCISLIAGLSCQLLLALMMRWKQQWYNDTCAYPLCFIPPLSFLLY